MTKKIALIGIGYIGTTILEAISRERSENLIIQAVYDTDESKLKECENNHPSIRIMKNSTDFQDCDIIVECATQQVVETLFDEIVDSEKYFVPLSIGAFISNPQLFSKYQDLDDSKKKRIILPSVLLF